MEAEGCTQGLLDELKHMSADPEKNSRKRLFKSNFRFDRTYLNLLPATPADCDCEHLDLAIE